MSTTQQHSLWSPISCSDSPHSQDYISSGQEASMELTPILTNEEAYYNQYQAQLKEHPSKDYVFTPTNISGPFASIQRNPAAVFYSQLASQAAYQSVYQGAGPQTGLMTTQGYDIQTQAALDLQYGGHQILAPSEGDHTKVYFNSLGYQSVMLQDKLDQHQTCIKALMKLEADLEVLSKETFQQRLEIRMLENSCKKKDNTIAVLKQHSNLHACGTSTQNDNCNEKEMSKEMFNSEKVWEPENKDIETPVPNAMQIEGSRSYDKFLCMSSSETVKQWLLCLRLENRDIIRLQAQLCKLELRHDELKHIKEENSFQRHEITQLERRLQTFEEDSGISIISRDLTSFGESSSDYTATVDLEAKALSIQTMRSQKSYP